MMMMMMMMMCEAAKMVNHGAQVLGPQWTSTNRSPPAGSTKVEKVALDGRDCDG